MYTKVTHKKNSCQAHSMLRDSKFKQGSTIGQYARLNVNSYDFQVQIISKQKSN